MAGSRRRGKRTMTSTHNAEDRAGLEPPSTVRSFLVRQSEVRLPRQHLEGREAKEAKPRRGIKGEGEREGEREVPLETGVRHATNVAKSKLRSGRASETQSSRPERILLNS